MFVHNGCCFAQLEEKGGRVKKGIMSGKIIKGMMEIIYS